MAVRDRIVRMPHARERAARRPDDGKDERAAQILREAKAGNFLAVALKGNLVARLRDYGATGFRGY